VVNYCLSATALNGQLSRERKHLQWVKSKEALTHTGPDCLKVTTIHSERPSLGRLSWDLFTLPALVWVVVTLQRSSTSAQVALGLNRLMRFFLPWWPQSQSQCSGPEVRCPSPESSVGRTNTALGSSYASFADNRIWTSQLSCQYSDCAGCSAPARSRSVGRTNTIRPTLVAPLCRDRPARLNPSSTFKNRRRTSEPMERTCPSLKCEGRLCAVAVPGHVWT
jgi:hypothetical protein